jgi:SAM-dependent methyltransferase
MDFRYTGNRVLAKLGSMLPDRELLELADRLRGRDALEIGGPSALFSARGRFPLYPRLATLDTCNYASSTVWNRTTPDTPDTRAAARAFIAEARDLAGVPDGGYELLLASHVIEHLANPLGALRAWRRTLKPTGELLLIIPHREGTFDHRRPVTTLDHLRADAAADTNEDDETHLAESLALTDLARHPCGTTSAEFRALCTDNLRSRVVHHHVFDARAAVSMCGEAGWGVMHLACRRPHHIICLAGPTADCLDDAAIAKALSVSPFRSDRAGAPRERRSVQPFLARD